MMEMWKVFCVISIDNRWSDSPNVVQSAAKSSNTEEGE